MSSQEQITVFADAERVASGDRAQISTAVRALLASGDERTILAFSDGTGSQIDIDLREAPTDIATPDEAEKRRKPGRPKLGVVGREVTLLPRHWEWLNAQPGGASVALRKLVEHARRDNADNERVGRSQGAAYRFMSAIAGNEAGFEEAIRSLYARDQDSFESLTQNWPADVRDYARELAAEAFLVT